MANHGPPGVATDTDESQYRVPSSESTYGGKLLLVGVVDHDVLQLAQLYRQAGRTVPVMQNFATAAGALERLAEVAFDCILVLNCTGDLNQPGIDAQSFCTATRAAGCADAILVLAATARDSLWKVTCETDAELYVGSPLWQSATLLLLLDRAVLQRSMVRDSQRRQWAEVQRMERERDDCANLLRQQRQLLQVAPIRQFGSVEAILPPELPKIYRELLRTYVMTGTVNLALEIKKLAQTFALVHLTPRQVLQLHLDQLDQVIKGIGQRSARHIVDRANVLCLELMVLLCECLAEQNARTWWAWRRQPVNDSGLSLERRAA